MQQRTIHVCGCLSVNNGAGLQSLWFRPVSPADLPQGLPQLSDVIVAGFPGKTSALQYQSDGRSHFKHYKRSLLALDDGPGDETPDGRLLGGLGWTAMGASFFHRACAYHNGFVLKFYCVQHELMPKWH